MRVKAILVTILVILGLSTLTCQAFVSPSDLFSKNTKTPGSIFQQGDWGVNNMKFFQNTKASAQPNVGKIPASDYQAIMDYLAKLPPPDQMAQQAQDYYNSTNASVNNSTNSTTPDPLANMTSGVPSDKVLFIEESRTTMPVSPATSGFAYPNVSFYYKYDESNKSLTLKDKGGTSVNDTAVIVGYTEENDATSRFLFDYDLGGQPPVTLFDVGVEAAGDDGSAMITANGNSTVLKPGEKTDYTVQEDGLKTTVSITNRGLISKSDIAVKSSL